MGVQLNIKDRETVRLARELAGRTGRTVTETIRAALEAAHAEREADGADRISEANRIVTDFRASLTPQQRAITSAEAIASIYGPDGLPEE